MPARCSRADSAQNRPRRLWRRRIALAALVLGVVACAEVSDPTHIRRGASPQFVDDLVRFRTTYYFRLF